MATTAVSNSQVARVVGIQTIFQALRGGAVWLPQQIGIVAQGATANNGVYPLTKQQFTNSGDVGTLYGFGSPAHLASQQFLPANGNGIGVIPMTIYPLNDETASVAAAGSITPAGTITKQAAFLVRVNNIDSPQFVVNVGESVAQVVTKIFTAIQGNVNLPVTATDSATQCDVTAKWKGVSGNDIHIEIIGPTDAGLTFTITQPTGGLVNPNATSLNAALAQMGNVWQTMMLNCLDIADTAALNVYQTFGEGRWGSLVKKPLVFFTGNTEKDVATAVTVSNARPTDRINGQLVAPGCNNLPFVVAARQLAKIVVRANEQLAFDFGGLDATGLVPGADDDQWDNTEKQLAVTSGSSTSDSIDGVVNIGDVITFYKPTGEDPPAYRFLVDIVRTQNIIFNLDLIFNRDDWNGAPLIPDEQPTVNRDAKKPRMAKADIASLVDALALNAIIADDTPGNKETKGTITATIGTGTNNKRLDISLKVKYSSNSNVISIDFYWGFYFGTETVVA